MATTDEPLAEQLAPKSLYFAQPGVLLYEPEDKQQSRVGALGA